MATRYYELIVSGRQLVLLAAGLVGLMGVAFVLGVGVGLQQPRLAAEEVAVRTPPVLPEPGLAAPGLPTAVPTAAPTPEPPAPAALPVQTPAATSEAPAPPMPATPTATPRPARPTAVTGHWVQVAAVSRVELAEGVRQRVMALGFRPEQVVVRPMAGGYRVRLGPFPDGASAARVVSRLRAQGFADAFAVSE